MYLGICLNQETFSFVIPAPCPAEASAKEGRRPVGHLAK